MRDGNLVPKNPEEAYYHFQVAALKVGKRVQHELAKDLVMLSANLTGVQAQIVSSRERAVTV